MDKSAAQHTTWLKEENMRAYSDDHVQSSTKHPMDFVAHILQEKGQANKRIAAEYDTYYFTARNLLQLTNNLPDATFIDGTSLINWLRIVKSEREIKLIKRAAKIVTNTMHKGIERIEAGVRE